MDAKLFDSLCEECQAKAADAGEMPEEEGEGMEGPDDDWMGVEPPSVGKGEPPVKPLKKMEDAEKRASLRISIGMMPKGKKAKEEKK